MTATPAARAPRRRRGFPRWLLVTILAAALVVILVVIGVVGWLVTSGLQALGAQPPAVGTTIVAPAEAKSAKAVLDDDASTREQIEAAQYLAAQPTAYWLTPEIDPIGEVGARVLNLASEAREQNASLAVVVYGLPERDCGNHSAGGLDDADYDTWTTQIGEALDATKDVQKIVVLEPDSLALAPECGNVDERVAQLHDAVGRLTGVDTWIYLDGGHSNWVPADQMAALIDSVDVEGDVRGFTTNVSNFNTTTDEFSYAHEVAGILGWGHALIDTSRNGAGATPDWCNPPGRLVGDAGGTYGDDVVDTNLWIKPPGESDGECNGGPAAGVWWPDAAVELTREAR
ncbi:glycoside hydrolase family 6 protein [Microbacterium sp. cx-59]|uniref:glycoside hydrolase family 6 protein n=1 Tax=Microbacterium sp. cx-59 TaxID=2891207 RepID=UPI001E4830EF|nr:glycoside hydrolase family 6 protein [Microbacterium sp. cx-59]MCC4908191.1 glycoside hydrolase family 6 protein [Microbacterium sp. cx-59]